MEDKDDFGCLELIHESLKEMEALQLEMVLAEPECFLSFLSAFNGEYPLHDWIALNQA